VFRLINDLDIDADTHSNGETQLTHRAKNASRLKKEIASIKENYGVSATYHPKEELIQLGLGRRFHRGLTIPIRFSLNPHKYAAGLSRNAISGGTKVYGNTAVEKISKFNRGFNLRTQNAEITADRIIQATNDYSSEDIPSWIRALYARAVLD